MSRQFLGKEEEEEEDYVSPCDYSGASIRLN
jgi:hypothetical protein